jgi:peptide/nickel transport system permease protein
VVQYVVRRILQSAVVVVGVSVLSFWVMFLNGDPTSVMVPSNWTTQQIQAFRHQMGFDRPWIVQYADYLKGAIHGNLGMSLKQNEPVSHLILSRMPATIELAVAAMVLSIAVSVPLGVLASRRRGSWVDSFSMLFALAGQSIPVFWLGLMFIMLFGIDLQWFPVAGMGGWRHLVMPAVALALFFMGRNARMVRSCMLEVLSADHVRTARGKGLAEAAVVYKHALRNALIPVITLMGLDIGTLLGGAVVTETVFAWPGVGRLTLQAIYDKDFPLVQGAVIMLAIVFVITNLIVDLTYAWLDPRVRLA